MAWRWTAHRLLVSAFLIVHVSATIVWVMPPSPVKQRCYATVAPYILSLGLWQCWAMFSPDPFREVLVLEADVARLSGASAIISTSPSSPTIPAGRVWRATVMPSFRSTSSPRASIGCASSRHGTS